MIDSRRNALSDVGAVLVLALIGSCIFNFVIAGRWADTAVKENPRLDRGELYRKYLLWWFWKDITIALGLAVTVAMKASHL
jgi:hypothetical protein